MSDEQNNKVNLGASNRRLKQGPKVERVFKKGYIFNKENYLIPWEAQTRQQRLQNEILDNLDLGSKGLTYSWTFFGTVDDFNRILQKCGEELIGTPGEYDVIDFPWAFNRNGGGNRSSRLIYSPEFSHDEQPLNDLIFQLSWLLDLFNYIEEDTKIPVTKDQWIIFTYLYKNRLKHGFWEALDEMAIALGLWPADTEETHEQDINEIVALELLGEMVIIKD